MISQLSFSRWLYVVSGIVLTLVLAYPLQAKIAKEDQVLRSAFSGQRAAEAFLISLARVEERIFATGQGGIIIFSDDEGVSWTQSEVPITVTITSITFADAEHGWAVGHDLTILHTSDGGLTWRLQYFDPEVDTPLLEVWFKDQSTGYAVGGRGNFMWTTDGGKVWNIKEVWTDDELVPDAHLFTIRSAPNGFLYMVAEVGTLFRSKDNGENWEVLDSPYRGSFFGMTFPDDNTAIAYAMLGNAAISSDLGDSWSSLSLPVNKSLMTDHISDDGTVVLAGLAGAIVVSNDGGKTFQDRSLEDRIDITGILPLKNGKWLVASGKGVIEVEF